VLLLERFAVLFEKIGVVLKLPAILVDIVS